MVLVIGIIAAYIAISIIAGNIVESQDKKKSEKKSADDTAVARLNMHNHKYISQEPFSDGWSLVRLNDFRYAYVDKQGNYLGNYLFTNAKTFNNGVALGNIINQGWCLIRKDGSFALAPLKLQNKERYIESLTDKYFLVSDRIPIKRDTVRYEYYLITRDGDFITKKPFDKFLDFSDGIFRVRTEGLIYEYNEKGDLLNPPFSEKIELGNGLFKVREKEYRWGIYDSNIKQLIIPCRYSDISYVPVFDHFILETYTGDGLAGKSYVVDRNNKQIIPPLYSSISIYKNKFYHVGNFRPEGTGLLCGLCDKEGNVLIQPNFQDIWIGETGFMVSSKEGRCGIVNKSGYSALEYDSYDSVYLTEGGTTPSFLIVQKKNKYGVIDISGNIIMPLEYDTIESCEGEDNVPSCYIIQKGEKFGVANLDGEIIIPIDYDKIEYNMDAGASIYIPLHYIGPNSSIEDDMKEFKHYDEYCKGKPRYFILFKDGKSYTVTQNNEAYTPKPTRDELMRVSSQRLTQTTKDEIENAGNIAPKVEVKPKITIQKPREMVSSVSTPKFTLFFDTETTGLPQNYNAPISAVNNWPRLVQLSWLLVDDNFNIVSERDIIIKPENFAIPTMVSNLHGITTEKALSIGIELSSALSMFLDDISKSKICVGHNVEFDKKIVCCELYRKGMRDTLAFLPSTCTMQSTVNLCKIPGNYGYRYPKLQELYKYLFGLSFVDAHNSLADVRATFQCYKELKSRNVI